MTETGVSKRNGRAGHSSIRHPPLVPDPRSAQVAAVGARKAPIKAEIV